MFNIIVKHGSIMFYTYYTLRNIKNKNSDGKIIVPSKLVKTNIYAHTFLWQLNDGQNINIE